MLIRMVGGFVVASKGRLLATYKYKQRLTSLLVTREYLGTTAESKIFIISPRSELDTRI